MFRSFVLMRLVVGGASYLAPRLSARLSGFDPDGNPQAAYWARLFGVRDVVLGIGALQAEGDARRRIVKLTAVCDAVDLVSALAERRAGYLSTGTAALAGAVAITAGAVAASAAAELDRGP
jgi:hypothetical protein